jgi:hypothetical protein
MNDTDGPQVAEMFYEKLFEERTINADTIPYALDHSVSCLKQAGVALERWVPFIHIGA